jgi:hypothetical protein
VAQDRRAGAKAAYREHGLRPALLRWTRAGTIGARRCAVQHGLDSTSVTRKSTETRNVTGACVHVSLMSAVRSGPQVSR